MAFFRNLFGGKKAGSSARDVTIKQPDQAAATALGAFLAGGEIGHGSTYALYYRWDRKLNRLTAFFDDGQQAFYECDVRTAIDFFNAKSKGIFVWDRFRVRGTVHEHRVPWGYR